MNDLTPTFCFNGSVYRLYTRIETYAFQTRCLKAGQRIKNLYKGTNNGKLALKWNGTNESGQKVVPGVYLCIVNGQLEQVILEGGEGKK